MIFNLLLNLTLNFTATVYHAVENQTDDSPTVTSSGYKINDIYCPPKIIALPRHYIYEGIVEYGDTIFLYCNHCELEGEYVVQDIMNDRYTWCNNVVDVLVSPSVYTKVENVELIHENIY